MKVTVIKIKNYQLKNISIKFDHMHGKTSYTWKIQLTITNDFISSIDNDGELVMHSKSDTIEIMVNDEADEVIKEMFDSPENRY